VQTCTRCSTQSPDSATHCLKCQADLKEFSTTAISLARMRSNPRVKDVRLVVAHDCCPACADMEGTYDKEQAPSLPVEGCSHALGCRCFYEPMLNTIYP
jgi:hypothetical protein